MKFFVAFLCAATVVGCSPRPDTRTPEEQTGSKYGSGSGEVRGPELDSNQQWQVSAQKAGTSPTERNTNANSVSGAPRVRNEAAGASRTNH